MPEPTTRPPTTVPVPPPTTTFMVSVAPKVEGKFVVGVVLKAMVGATAPAVTSVRLQSLRDGEAIRRVTKAMVRTYC